MPKKHRRQRQARKSPTSDHDTAKLDANAQALAVRFSLRFLDWTTFCLPCAPSSTDADDLVRQYRDSVASFIERAKTS